MYWHLVLNPEEGPFNTNWLANLHGVLWLQNSWSNYPRLHGSASICYKDLCLLLAPISPGELHLFCHRAAWPLGSHLNLPALPGDVTPLEAGLSCITELNMKVWEIWRCHKSINVKPIEWLPNNLWITIFKSRAVGDQTQPTQTQN